MDKKGIHSGKIVLLNSDRDFRQEIPRFQTKVLAF